MRNGRQHGTNSSFGSFVYEKSSDRRAVSAGDNEKADGHGHNEKKKYISVVPLSSK